jgi:hypothetical protein
MGFIRSDNFSVYDNKKFLIYIIICNSELKFSCQGYFQFRWFSSKHLLLSVNTEYVIFTPFITEMECYNRFNISTSTIDRPFPKLRDRSYNQ